ncbi:MAG TPA: sodium-dependent bicarbonate transport family permease [Microbacteriaceae bacterium]|nr:sodium-dependent bicarbonate transport family permease [Microbacteriaceae bacterium]
MDLGFLSATATNLLSPAVLAFVLGVLAIIVKSDLKLPDSITQGISLYLLFAIGLKGGVGLRTSDPAESALGAVAALGLGIVIPFLAFWALRFMTRLDATDRGAVAAHYGSTSLVTFTAALVFLQSASVVVPGYAATMLTVLEVPGIVIGIFLARRLSGDTAHWGRSLHEIVTGKSIVLLVGGMVIGAIAGPEGMKPIAPLFVDLYKGVLVFFLLSLGLEVGARVKTIRSAGPGLVIFAIVFPVCAGTLGAATAAALGLGVGASAILAVLCASASYIAAPAAVRFSLPQANLAFALTASLAVTFPFNVTFGIPLYTWIASVFVGG